MTSRRTHALMHAEIVCASGAPYTHPSSKQNVYNHVRAVIRRGVNTPRSTRKATRRVVRERVKAILRERQVTHLVHVVRVHRESRVPRDPVALIFLISSEKITATSTSRLSRLLACATFSSRAAIVCFLASSFYHAWTHESSRERERETLW